VRFVQPKTVTAVAQPALQPADAEQHVVQAELITAATQAVLSPSDAGQDSAQVQSARQSSGQARASVPSQIPVPS
jgi:hypothetical protein